jgi:hypothetical protein
MLNEFPSTRKAAPWTYHQSCPSKVNFEAQNGDIQPGKEYSFDPEVGHCTAVNKFLDVK